MSLSRVQLWIISRWVDVVAQFEDVVEERSDEVISIIVNSILQTRNAYTIVSTYTFPVIVSLPPSS